MILDVPMPLLSGPEAFRAMRGLDPNLRCFCITGNLAPYSAEDLYRAGVLEIHYKPFDLLSIVHSATAAMGRGQKRKTGQ